MVVGGGDSACEEALYLTRFGSVVHLVHRRDSLRASKIMVERTLSNPKIKPVWDSAVTEILDVKQDKVTGVRLKNLKTGAESVLNCAGVFIAIGHGPNTEIFKGQIEMDASGYVIPQRGTRTNVPGVFVAGDCADQVYRQAITAAGAGCAAAIDAETISGGTESVSTEPINTSTAGLKIQSADEQNIGGRFPERFSPLNRSLSSCLLAARYSCA